MDREQRISEENEIKRRLDELDFLDFVKYLAGRIKWIAAFAAVAVALAAAYVFLIAKPEYEAEVQVYASSGEASATNFANMQMGSYLVADYEYVSQAWEVQKQVIENLNLPYTLEEFGKMLKIENPKGTRLLIVKVCAEDPEEAAQIANEYALVASRYISEAMLTNEPMVVSRAHVPEKPLRPKKLMTLAVAAVASSFAAVCVLMIVFLSDDRIRRAEDLWRYFRRRPLAEFLLTKETGASKDHAVQKEMRMLCARLTMKKDVRRLLLTSCCGEEKRFAANALAEFLAELGKRVVIVQMTLSKKKAHPGLTDCLAECCDLHAALRPASVDGVYCMSAGSMTKEMTSLMASPRLEEFLNMLSGCFDVVVIDAPSLKESVDPLRMAAHCDSVLLMIQKNATRAKDIASVLQQLEDAAGGLVEIVLNEIVERK